MRAVPAIVCALLLVQGSPLPEAILPAPPAAGGHAASDRAYADAVSELAAADAWNWEAIAGLRANSPARAASLSARVALASDLELTLLATLGSGCEAESALADAFLRRACAGLPEAAAVACLLAPASVPRAWWPALAHLAARPRAPLPVRAASIARLLESGCDSVWPWARAVLLTGTARDEGADPFADWQRGGRYELPKRLIVAALDARAEGLGLPRGAFEPNAPWAEQVRDVERIGIAFARPRPQPGMEAPPTWRALVGAAAAGDPAARRALALLGAEHPALLRQALGSGDAAAADAARRAVAERPR